MLYQLVLFLKLWIKKKKKKELRLSPLPPPLDRQPWEPLSLRTNAAPCIPYSPTTAPVPALLGTTSKHPLGCLGPHSSARLQLHLTSPWRCLCTELPAGLCSRTTYKCGSQLMGHQGRAAQCRLPQSPARACSGPGGLLHSLLPWLGHLRTQLGWVCALGWYGTGCAEARTRSWVALLWWLRPERAADCCSTWQHAVNDTGEGTRTWSETLRCVYCQRNLLGPGTPSV